MGIAGLIILLLSAGSEAMLNELQQNPTEPLTYRPPHLQCHCFYGQGEGLTQMNFPVPTIPALPDKCRYCVPIQPQQLIPPPFGDQQRQQLDLPQPQIPPSPIYLPTPPSPYPVLPPSPRFPILPPSPQYPLPPSNGRHFIEWGHIKPLRPIYPVPIPSYQPPPPPQYPILPPIHEYPVLPPSQQYPVLPPSPQFPILPPSPQYPILPPSPQFPVLPPSPQYPLPPYNWGMPQIDDSYLQEKNTNQWYPIQQDQYPSRPIYPGAIPSYQPPPPPQYPILPPIQEYPVLPPSQQYPVLPPSPQFPILPPSPQYPILPPSPQFPVLPPSPQYPVHTPSFPSQFPPFGPISPPPPELAPPSNNFSPNPLNCLEYLRQYCQLQKLNYLTGLQLCPPGTISTPFHPCISRSTNGSCPPNTACVSRLPFESGFSSSEFSLSNSASIQGTSIFSNQLGEQLPGAYPHIPTLPRTNPAPNIMRSLAA